jgi:rfaE bifunctional protein kinase chain/domain
VVRALLRGGARVPVVVDSRYESRGYRRVTALTPSVPELEEAYRCASAAEASVARRLGRRLLEEARARAVLVTRGRQGMLLLERGGRATPIPAFGTDQVVDVTGAGDTVSAAFTAALAAGADFEAAARLANIAGGLVVRKRGTATVSAAEIRAALSA